MTGRPRQHDERVSTQVRFTPDLHARLGTAANERDLSVNWLIVRACEDFLSRLLPVEEMVFTRPVRIEQPKEQTS